MKLFLILTLLSSVVFAKSCYKDKSKNEIVCYYKYFDRTSIYKPKDEETYYIMPNKNIYALSDKIEVKFNAISAILSVIKDFEMDFIDKLKNDTYIFKVRNKSELFSILTNLNDLSAIQKAIPSKERKYTKTEIRIRVQRAKERQKSAYEKSKNKDKRNVGFDQGFGSIGGSDEKTPKNFLSGEH